MDILQAITQELGVQKWQVEAAVKLIDEGNTIPFISRYRKEATAAAPGIHEGPTIPGITSERQAAPGT